MEINKIILATDYKEQFSNIIKEIEDNHPDLICPISLSLMVEPVYYEIEKVKQRFEKSEILKVQQTSAVCPLTRKNIKDLKLIRDIETEYKIINLISEKIAEQNWEHEELGKTFKQARIINTLLELKNKYIELEMSLENELKKESQYYNDIPAIRIYSCREHRLDYEYRIHIFLNKDNTVESLLVCNREFEAKKYSANEIQKMGLTEQINYFVSHPCSTKSEEKDLAFRIQESCAHTKLPNRTVTYQNYLQAYKKLDKNFSDVQNQLISGGFLSKKEITEVIEKYKQDINELEKSCNTTINGSLKEKLAFTIFSCYKETNKININLKNYGIDSRGNENDRKINQNNIDNYEVVASFK